MVWLLYIIFAIFSYPFTTWYGGYIITKLWAWFVVPVFHLPYLSVYQAVGLSMTAGIFLLGVSVAAALANK